MICLATVLITQTS